MDANLYDAVIVGGGVCGAMVALKLARAGKTVLILEAGLGGADLPGNYRKYLERYHVLGSGRGAPNGPYPSNRSALSPNDADGDEYFVQNATTHFLSDYLRMLGGTTLHWQGTSPRMLPNDFRMREVYGRAINWPLGYADLEPYYCEAEKEIGVAANVEDQAQHGITFSPGYVYPMEKMPPSMGDQFLQRKLDRATIRLYGGEYPLGVVSMPVGRNATPNPKYDGGRGYRPVGMVGDPFTGERCQGNSACTPLCPVQAKYNALKTLEAARAAGRVEVRSQCVASRMKFDPATGRVIGVEYKRYEQAGHPAVATGTVSGTIVVLAANAIENAVLALASGVVDKSGQLGANLMDHPYLNLFALAPEPIYPFRGPDTTSGVETLRDGKFREKHAAWRAGIGNWGWGGEPANTITDLLGKHQFGKAFRRQLRDRMTRMFKIGTMVEQLPNNSNRVTIDPNKTDLLGNHLPILTYDYDAYTLDAVLAIMGVFWPAVVSRSGLTDMTDFTAKLGGTQPRTYQGHSFRLAGSGHLGGTHRMGLAPAISVLDPNLRSWAHPNLYMVGAGSMVTMGTSNPTLTATALSLRVGDHLVKTLGEPSVS